MATAAQFYGRVSLVSGVLALIIASSYHYIFWGGGIGSLNQGMEFSRFVTLITIIGLLYHATPLLSFIAFFAGVPAWNHRTAQIGMVLASLAAMGYLMSWVLFYRILLG